MESALWADFLDARVEQVWPRSLYHLENHKKLMTEAFCVKEKAKREMNGASEVRMKNGRRALQGTCASCGTKLFRILGKVNETGGPLAVDSPLRIGQLVTVVPSQTI